jgi:hypothetical protein
MNFKMISVACAAALCATGAFAATKDSGPCGVDKNITANQLVNACAPDNVFIVAGATAQKAAIAGVLDNGGTVFDTAHARAKLSLAAGTGNPNTGNTTAWYGYNSAGKRVMVIYMSANGSAMGGNLVLNGKGTAAAEETQILTPAIITTGVVPTTPNCTTTVTTPVLGALDAYTCTVATSKLSDSLGLAKDKIAHLAVLDVRPNELTPGVLTKDWAPAKAPAQITGYQGFGIFVNPTLYSALIAQQVNAGSLPSTCASSEVVSGSTYTVTAACQPSISRTVYSSIVLGKVKTAADAFGFDSSDTKKIVLARRVDSSGTQAASNIFFAGRAGYSAKKPSLADFYAFTGLAGAADVGTVDTTTGAVTTGSLGNLVVKSHAGTGDVINTVKAVTGDYALGVVSLENYFDPVVSASKLKGGLFVKLDGQSPNFKADGSLDAKARTALQAGYPLAFEMVAVTNPAVKKSPYTDIASAIISGLKNPTNDLAGIAYIGSSDAAKNTVYGHGSSNFLPVVKNAN